MAALKRRIDALERRLAALESQPRPPRPSRRNDRTGAD
jgi:hypothetical protein